MNLDDLDLNPLLVQVDPGENLRYCKDNHINKVPETLDEKIWSEIKNKIDLNKENDFEYEIENTSRSVGTGFHTTFIRNMEMKKLKDKLLISN